MVASSPELRFGEFSALLYITSCGTRPRRLHQHDMLPRSQISCRRFSSTREPPRSSRDRTVKRQFRYSASSDANASKAASARLLIVTLSSTSPRSCLPRLAKALRSDSDSPTLVAARNSMG